MVTAEDREFTQVTELVGSQVLNRALLLCSACKGSFATICLFLMGFFLQLCISFLSISSLWNTVHCMDLGSLACTLKHTNYIQFLFFMIIVPKNQQHLQCRAVLAWRHWELLSGIHCKRLGCQHIEWSDSLGHLKKLLKLLLILAKWAKSIFALLPCII